MHGAGGGGGDDGHSCDANSVHRDESQGCDTGIDRLETNLDALGSRLEYMDVVVSKLARVLAANNDLHNSKFDSLIAFIDSKFTG